MFRFSYKMKGSSLIELLISAAIFCFITISLLAVLHMGSLSWRTADEKYTIEQNLRRAVSSINFTLKNSSISSFNAGRLNKNGQFYSWMAFKSGLFFDGTNSALVNHLDFHPEGEGVNWHFFCIYYLEPQIDATGAVLPVKNLVAKYVPINASGNSNLNTLVYMTDDEAEKYIVYSGDSFEDFPITSFTIAEDIAAFTAEFNDLSHPEKQNSSLITDGVVRYSLTALKEMKYEKTKSGSKLDEDVIRRMIEEQNDCERFEEDSKGDMESGRRRAIIKKYSITMEQSIAPMN